jgi:hypothetical protein
MKGVTMHAAQRRNLVPDPFDSFEQFQRYHHADLKEPSVCGMPAEALRKLIEQQASASSASAVKAGHQ